MRPKFGAHISIVRGGDEGISQGTLERNLNGEWIDFNYSNEIELVINYVWMPVWGDALYAIRERVGVPREPVKSFHMTVGRTE